MVTTARSVEFLINSANRRFPTGIRPNGTHTAYTYMDQNGSGTTNTETEVETR